MSAPAKRRSTANRQSREEPLATKQEKTETENAFYVYDPWAPQGQTAFKLFMSARLCSAVWNIISDCDETYNYWEPTYFMMFGKGFQTWEYAPQYALRSYAYLWLHTLPMKLYRLLFGGNKVVLFYFLRCCLAIICAFCELCFYRGVVKQFGGNVGRLTLWFLLLSSGMFISCAAYLPSSFSMYFTLLSLGTWYMGHFKLSIPAVACSAIIGWPFSAVLGLPIALDIIFRRKKYKIFCIWSAVSFGTFLGPCMQLDSNYYGRIVVAPLNIIMYNVFGSKGPELYGVEPMSYYFINGFLNFNFVFLLALMSLPFCIYVRWAAKWRPIPRHGIPLWLAITPMYIWIIIFFTRPHKEERFLFPVYPMFAMCGALTLDRMQKYWSHVFHRNSQNHYTEGTGWMPAILGIVFSVLCLSRTVAIYQNYHAPMEIYMEMHKISNDPKIHTLSPDRPVNVCVGKEWYRFPSNFFLPGDNWNLQFIKSEFKGQLPRSYAEGPDSSKMYHEDFNNMNLEEPSRYINISRCHYLVDLDGEDETIHEPKYSQMKNDWKVLASIDFLDAKRSPRFFRAFYIPFISSRYCKYSDYNLMKTTKTKKSSRNKHL